MINNKIVLVLLSLVLVLSAFIGCEDSNDDKDKDTYVEDNYTNADMARGGQLYDKWWKITGADAPTTDFEPLWSSQTTNTRSGSDTWRCKECHGWDYIGKDGRYSSGSHYTGFDGISAAKNSDITDIFNSIKDVGGDHELSSVLADEDILDLTKFVAEGQIDMSPYINSDGTANGDITNGQTLFEATCASSDCHGLDGNAIDFKGDDGIQGIGWLSNDNPQETLHKILWGQPATYMPSMIADGKTAEESADILAYSQTLNLVTDLNVATVSSAPTVDGSGSDVVWSEADALELTLGQEFEYTNAFGEVDLTLKAVTVSSNLYILAEWMDPSGTESVDKNQWTYSAADGWTKSGNEDRLFFMFDAGDNGTEGANCATMCHVADGAMWTTGGGHVDVWHSKAARTWPVGTTDDKWWDGTGRNSDAKTVSAYSNNKQTLSDGSTVPLYSGPITDGHFIIVPAGETADSYCTPFDTTATSGTFPGYILNENRDGSRFADIETQATYSGGKWTVELKRALNTGNDDDVAFTAGSNVQMTVAITDNSGGNHSGAAPFFIKF